MPALNSRDGTTDAQRRRRSGGRRSLTAPVALASLVIALTMMLGSPGSSSADNGPNDVDVDPDSAGVTAGDLVTLTAVLTAGLDVESTGQVSFYFMPGSPNDTVAAPDFTCDGSAGSCAISYTATNAGVDTICATSRSTADGCAEPVATDDATSTDVVERIVAAATPTPVPTPTPTPTPTPSPPPTDGFDVDPDDATGSVGQPLTLTAFLDPSDDDPDADDDGRTINFFFVAGSANDTGLSPDLTCAVVAGSCSVSYTPTFAGTDLICATSHDDERHCDEPWDAPEGGNKEDVVRRTVVESTPTFEGWFLGINPPSVVQDTTNDFTVRVMHTASGGNLGCAIIDVPSMFVVLDADITDTSTGASWSLSRSGNRVQVSSDGGSGKLSQGEWLDFSMRVTAPSLVGSYPWLGWASPSPSCGGEPSYLTDQSTPVAVTSLNPSSTPVPTPVPTPDPTPVPTPVPTPDPTPVPTPVPTPDPTPVPTPVSPAVKSTSATSDPIPTPTPAPSEDLLVPLATDRSSGQPPAAPSTQGGADFLWQVWNAAADGIGRAVRPEAAAQVATTFGFPLALMVAVLLFLVVQDRVDRRDPKLRAAPRSIFDTVVRFKDESEL